jgi:hypothetical protein
MPLGLGSGPAGRGPGNGHGLRPGADAELGVDPLDVFGDGAAPTSIKQRWTRIADLR